jgi:hypothetical protein
LNLLNDGIGTAEMSDGQLTRQLAIQKRSFAMRRKLAFFVPLFLFVLVGNTTCFAQSELIFPVFVNTLIAPECQRGCRYWTSFASVFNPNDAVNTVTVTSYDSNGNMILSSGALSAPPFGAILPPGPSFRTGWMKITGSQALMGRERIQLVSTTVGSTNDVRSQIYLAPAPSGRRHFVKIESFGQIGLSIVFPSVAGNPPARGKLIHRGEDGEIVSEKELVIVPNGQLIGLLNDLVPPESFPNPNLRTLFGSFEIVFDHDVAMTTLEFNASEPIEEEVIEAFSAGIVAAR